MIEVKDLVKKFGATRAVNGLSLTVRPGEAVGLLGPNGAGKTTTLRILIGVLRPTSGAVSVDGWDVQTHPMEARRRVGYLSETNPLYDSLNVWETLTLFGRLRGLPRSGIKVRAREAVDRCSLGDALGKDVGALSKGYRQRLGLALALLADPPVLILDEPTSALDPHQQQDVRTLINDLKQKKTVLLSTHILSEAERLCDRLCILHRGTLAAEGTMDDLRKRYDNDRTCVVRFRGPADAIASALQSIPGIESVVPVSPDPSSEPIFRVTSRDDPREKINRLSQEGQWPILELRRAESLLDDIFRQATSAS